jgi:branched-chain amino acid transport system ATP-binding protein
MTTLDGLPTFGPGDTIDFVRGSALAAVELSAGYQGKAVVHDVTIKVDPGEVVALLGPNGAGKSTTLRAISGDLKPLSGKVFERAAEVDGPLYKRVRTGLAFVPQERSVAMSLSAYENARLGRGEPTAVFDMFPELADHAKRRCGLLSGGQQQMLTVGRALAADPFAVLADELSIGLAPSLVDRILTAVQAAARERQVGVLFVEQHLRQALQYADRAYVMRQGRIELEGTSDELLSNIAAVEALYLR